MNQPPGWMSELRQETCGQVAFARIGARQRAHPSFSPQPTILKKAEEIADRVGVICPCEIILVEGTKRIDGRSWQEKC